jgi:hypothetical protein
MINAETKAEIRNLIVKANLALHSSDIGGLLETLGGALSRVESLGLRDVEIGFSLPLECGDETTRVDVSGLRIGTDPDRRQDRQGSLGLPDCDPAET